MILEWQAYRYGFVAAVATAAAFLMYAVVSAPSRVANRLGSRGLRREQALSRGSIFPMVEPLVRWMGVRVSGLLSDGLIETLEKQLRVAGDFAGLTAEEYAGSMLICALGGVLLGMGLGTAIGNSGLMVLLCTPLAASMPYVTVSGEAQRRMQNVRRGLPGAIDLMTLSMSAGLDFPGAVRQVVEKATSPDAPIIEEFRHILSGLRLGRTRKQTLQEFAHRAPVASVREFVAAVVQAEERGNPLAQVLQIQAEMLRRGRTANAEEAAAKAAVSMTGPLFLLFVAIMILIMGPMILKMRTGL